MNRQEIEKAIGTLKKYHDLLLEVYADYSVYSKAENYSDKSLELASRANTVKNAVGTAITHMSQQLTNGWIPVSERLPEDTDGDNLATVYVCMKFKDSLFGNSNTAYQDVVDFVTDRKIWLVEDCFNVIAWRPRFEPYKEVSE